VKVGVSNISILIGINYGVFINVSSVISEDLICSVEVAVTIDEYNCMIRLLLSMKVDIL